MTQREIEVLEWARYYLEQYRNRLNKDSRERERQQRVERTLEELILLTQRQKERDR